MNFVKSSCKDPNYVSRISIQADSLRDKDFNQSYEGASNMFLCFYFVIPSEEIVSAQFVEGFNPFWFRQPPLVSLTPLVSPHIEPWKSCLNYR